MSQLVEGAFGSSSGDSTVLTLDAAGPGTVMRWGTQGFDRWK